MSKMDVDKHVIKSRIINCENENYFKHCSLQLVIYGSKHCDNCIYLVEDNEYDWKRVKMCGRLKWVIE